MGYVDVLTKYKDQTFFTLYPFRLDLLSLIAIARMQSQYHQVKSFKNKKHADFSRKVVRKPSESAKSA